MKYFTIIFAVCIASSLAGILTDKQKAQILEFKAACIAETGVSPDAVANAKKGTIDEGDEKLACFGGCLLQKTGFLNAEGVFEEANFRAHVPEGIPKEQVDNIVNKCGHLTGANLCETGGKMLKCYLENKTTSLLE